MKKRAVLIRLILGALTVIIMFIVFNIKYDEPQTSQSPKQKKSPVVEIMLASKATVSLGLELSGSAEPYRIARLASPAEGPVSNIYVREGDRVKTGDVLLCIGRNKAIDALIVSLQKELKEKEENLQRTRQLVEREAIPGEQLDQARTSYEKVYAELVKAKEVAQDYTIKAPWKGVVSRVLVKDGDCVAPRATLLEMYDPSSMVVRTDVPEQFASQVMNNMRVRVKLDAYPDTFFEGHITRVYPSLDPRLHTRTVEIVLNKNRVQLLPGMFARLRLLLKTVNEAIVVPTEAVLPTPKGKVVFVLEDGKALARLVKTGIEEDNRIQIVSGINAGDEVIVKGNEKLKNGVAVRLAGRKKSTEEKPENMEKPSTEEKIMLEGNQK